MKDIRRATRKQQSAEEKIRIVLDGLRGEYSTAELCRREGIAESLYYTWSEEFLEAGKRRLAGDTARAATSSEVKDLRRVVRAMKVVVAELTLDLRLLKKRMARPVAGDFIESAKRSVCFNVSGFGRKPRPRWRYARPGPHKLPASSAVFLTRFPERRLTVRPSLVSPPANTFGRSASHALINKCLCRHRQSLGCELFTSP